MIDGAIYSLDDSYVIVFKKVCRKKTKRLLDKCINCMESYRSKLKVDVIDELKICDIDGYSKKTIECYKNKNKYFFLFSDTHLSTYYFMKDLGLKNSKIIVFDAHLDLRNIYIRDFYSKATWLRRAIEEGIVKKIYYVGIREYCKEEEEYLNYLQNVGKAKILRDVEEIPKDLDYVSIDIDVLDFHYVFDVEYPEDFGMNYYDLLKYINKIIEKNNVKFFDIVEFINLPSTHFASKIFFHIIEKIYEKLFQNNIE